MKNRYRFNVLSNFKTDGKCYEEKCSPKINEVGHQKKIIWAYTFHKNSWKNCKKWKLCSTISLFKHRSGFWLTFTGNILGTFSSQSRTPVIETVSKQYKIGYMVEATIASSYSNLFWAHLSNTWRWLYTHKKFPGVLNRIANNWSQAISSPRSGNTH